MRTVELPCPVCHDPEGINVTLDYCSGVTELGLLSGWSALEVTARCGCELREQERQNLATLAEYAQGRKDREGAKRYFWLEQRYADYENTAREEGQALASEVETQSERPETLWRDPSILRCLVHYCDEPCPTCQSYIAAGL